MEFLRAPSALSPDRRLQLVELLLASLHGARLFLLPPFTRDSLLCARGISPACRAVPAPPARRALDSMAAPWGFARSSARPAPSVLLLTTELSLQLLPLPLGSLLADALLDRAPCCARSCALRFARRRSQRRPCFSLVHAAASCSLPGVVRACPRAPPWRSCARVGPSLVSPMTRGFLREFCCVQLHLFPSSAACFSPLLVAPSCNSPCPHCSLLLLCLPSLQARRRSSPAAPLARLCAPRAPLPELTQIRQCLPQLDPCRAALRLTGVSPVRARSGRVRPCLFRRAWSLAPCARRCELVSHHCLVTETPTPTPSSMVTTSPNAFVAWSCVVWLVDLVRCRVRLFLMRIAQ
uniref:Uncharacterized protein n=1 Tax=Zea mays TaxID=4577 RepID=A0A804MG64_MAIZE